jgi:hypothetical protein
MVALADGGAATLAQQCDSIDSWGDAMHLVRTDANGDTKWTKEFSLVGKKILPAAIVPLVQGGYWLFASTSSGSGKGSWYARTDSLGKVLWSKPSLAINSAQHRTWGAVSDQGDGALVATSNENGNYATIVRLSSSGAVLGTAASPNPYLPPAGTHSLARLKSGDAALLQGKWEGKGPVHVTRFSKDLELVWTHPLGDGAAAVRAVDLVATDDGGLLVGARHTVGSAAPEWLLWRLSGDGNLLWQRIFGVSTGSFRALAGALDGGATLTGEGEGSANGSILVHVDAAGTVQWQRQFPGVVGNRISVLVQATGGGYLAAGFIVVPGTQGTDTWIVRTDNWGNSSCETSGTCWQKAALGCDDGNACTADSCTSGVCSQQSIPNCSIP